MKSCQACVRLELSVRLNGVKCECHKALCLACPCWQVRKWIMLPDQCMAALVCHSFSCFLLHCHHSRICRITTSWILCHSASLIWAPPHPVFTVSAVFRNDSITSRILSCKWGKCYSEVKEFNKRSEFLLVHTWEWHAVSPTLPCPPSCMLTQHFMPSPAITFVISCSRRLSSTVTRPCASLYKSAHCLSHL